MTDIGRLIIFAGLVLAAIGAVVFALGKLGFRGLPGDIRYEGESTRFYFPIVACIVISILMTLGAWVCKATTFSRTGNIGCGSKSGPTRSSASSMISGCSSIAARWNN